MKESNDGAKKEAFLSTTESQDTAHKIHAASSENEQKEGLPLIKEKLKGRSGRDALKEIEELCQQNSFSIDELAAGCNLLNFIYGDLGDTILSKYSQMVDEAVSAETSIENILKENIDSNTLLLVRRRIIERANLFLKKYFIDELQWFATFDASGDMKDELLSELNAIESDTIILTTTIKALYESGKSVSLEDLLSVQFVSGRIGDILEEDKQAMYKIYSKNYETTPLLKNTLLHAFQKKFSRFDGGNKERQLHLFKHNNKIRGFYCLEDTTPGHKYFSSFNIDSSYKGNKFGELLLTQSLSVEAENNIIDADCDREAPISSFYIENGFVGTGAFQFEEAAAMHIIKNKAIQDALLSAPELSREEIIALSTVNETVEKGEMLFVAHPVSQIKSMPFELLNEVASDGSRHVLTRYIRDRKDGAETAYAVFEKVSADDFARLMTPEPKEDVIQGRV